MTDKLRALVEAMDSRFVSGNAIPVERTHITSDEWRAIRILTEIDRRLAEFAVTYPGDESPDERRS